MTKVPDTDEQLKMIPREHYATCDECDEKLQTWVPLFTMSMHTCASCVAKREEGE